jgi:hypothetical protein
MTTIFGKPGSTELLLLRDMPPRFPLRLRRPRTHRRRHGSRFRHGPQRRRLCQPAFHCQLRARSLRHRRCLLRPRPLGRHHRPAGPPPRSFRTVSIQLSHRNRQTLPLIHSPTKPPPLHGACGHINFSGRDESAPTADALRRCLRRLSEPGLDSGPRRKDAVDDGAFFLVRRHKNMYMDISGIRPQELMVYFPGLEDIFDKVRRPGR